MRIHTLRRHARLFTGIVLAIVFTVTAMGSSASQGERLTIVTPTDGQTLTKPVRWEAVVNYGVHERIEFYVDGKLRWTERYVPYVFNGDNGMLSPDELGPGSHTLRAAIIDVDDSVLGDATITVTVPSSAPSQAPQSPPSSGSGSPPPAQQTAPPTSGGANLAAGKPTSASSSESSALAPERAVDGSTSTRWGSAFRNRQWWQVDLGSTSSVSAVSVNWERAFASRYKIQVSTNGSSFSDVADVSIGRAGVETTSFQPVQARYVRVYGMRKATQWGISAWEIEVYGSADSSATPSSPPPPPPPAPTTPAPVSLTAPSITGAPVEGSTLTAATGTWSGSPTQFTFEWQRCNTLGTACLAVGTDAPTYALTGADVGATLRVRVTASNATGSGTAVSSQTAVVTAAPAPAPTGPLGTKLPARLGSSSGSQYYVNGQSGSDSNPGTLSAPWRTIGKAWSAVSAGSVINLRAGTYSSQAVLMNKSASAGNPITLRAYAGESVTIRGVYIEDVTGLRVQGFRLSNPSGDGIKVTNSSDIEIVGNTITGNQNQGILVLGCCSGRTYSTNVQIWSNTIYGNGAGGSSSYSHGVYYGGTDSYSDGQRRGTVGGVIANNLLYDQPTGYLLQIGPQADGLIVTNNTFYQATASYPSGNAIHMWDMGGSYATKNLTIVNNAVTYNANMGVHGIGSSMSNNVVRSNLGYGNPGGDFVAKAGSATLFSTGSGNITGQDPRFVDRNARNFKPRADSPLVGRADPAYAPATDMNGTSRAGGPDIGALQH